MKIIVIADSDGNIIVKRKLKEGEDPADVFKQVEQEFFKSQRDGN